jgi:hypothetical protein
MIAHTSLLTHLLTIRDITLANSSHSKDSGAGSVAPAQLVRSGNEALGHKLVDGVVVAIVYAVDVC